MSKRKQNNISTTISSIVILLLVTMVIGFLFVYTDNFTTSLKSFYVTCGNDDFYSDRDNFTIVVGEDYKFDITTNINLTGMDSKYHVSVVPNNINKTTFSYSVDDNNYNYTDIESLMKGFSISTYEDYFILVATLDLPDIIKLYYPNQNIANVPTTLDTGIPYFRLVVESADNTETININFNLKSEK